MALIHCPDCGREVSDQAPSCVGCGRPIAEARPTPSTGTTCPNCKRAVQPVVTSVGGGSCSVGSRETWTCPACKTVMHRKGCFVASSTYGDEDAVEVRFLRAFRDEVLKKSRLGRFLVHVYYLLGPYAARVVEEVPGAKFVARSLLDRVVEKIETSTSLRRERHRRREY